MPQIGPVDSGALVGVDTRRNEGVQGMCLAWHTAARTKPPARGIGPESRNRAP